MRRWRGGRRRTDWPRGRATLRPASPSPMRDQPDWLPPPIVDEYRLLRPLGRGGMGQVILAHDQLLDRQVAIKFISVWQPDEKKRQRFLNEGRAIARLSH